MFAMFHLLRTEQDYIFCFEDDNSIKMDYENLKLVVQRMLENRSREENFSLGQGETPKL